MDDGIAALPAEGGTPDEARARQALLRAAALLDLPSPDRPGDLLLAKKAASALRRLLASDAALLDALSSGLDGYRADADADLLECLDLLAAFPDGAARAKLERKLLGIEALLAKEEAAAAPASRAALLGKVFRKLVPVKEALGSGPPGGPCPEPGIDSMNVGTVTAVVDGQPWSTTDVEVLVLLSSSTGNLLQVGFTATHPDGGKIVVTLPFDLYTGPGTYPFDTSGPWIGMDFHSPSLGPVFLGTTGTITISEFSYAPTASDPDVSGGRLVGTFSFNGCTTWSPGGACLSPDLPVAVTSGTFEVCNFWLARW